MAGDLYNRYMEEEQKEKKQEEILDIVKTKV